MFKFANNLRIKTVGNREIILVAALASFIWIVGLCGMNIDNISTTAINKNSLTAQASIGEARKSFLQIHILIDKAILKYDDTYDSQVEKENAKLEESMKAFKNIQQNDEIAGKVHNLEQYVDEYINTWEKSKVNLKKTGNLSQSQYNKFDDLINRIDNLLSEIKEDTEKVADKVDMDSSEIYKNNVKSIYIIIDIVLVFLVAAIYIIISIKTKLSEETANNLQVGDFGGLAVAKNTEEKDGFSTIKKALNKIIEWIKKAANSIKNKFMQIGHKAENLNAIAKELSLASQNVAATIENVNKDINSKSEDAAYINTLLEEFGGQLKEVMESMSSVVPSAEDIGDVAENNHKKVDALLNSMENIQLVFDNFSRKIGSVSTSINIENEVPNIKNEIIEQSKTSPENISPVIEELSQETNKLIDTSDEVATPNKIN